MAARIIILISTLSLLMGCSSSYQVEEMSVGVAAEKGPILMVGEVTFDETWSVPAGAIGCCWKDSGALSFVYDIPFPNTVVIAWYDLSTELFWVGEAKIDNKAGYEFIQQMKPFINRRTGQYKNRKHPNLIVGMKRDGLIKVWISNAPGNYLGRKILEIGSGIAQIKELPPENER
ncbi:DUF2931 family protein [Pseudoalteromonas luteoviolacea]|uniref:DUF2931 domain-containing protein n=1 Tax=Pseudoalteromonas luteoviolacea S4054 TaxID=1129367 RepID=A0A0F6AEH3_9GAMM|nr:DUF2931 family protein [Pseudoalteromonas luteoviolacea]AOT11213.1 hypothetical protein S4054249_25650 [Pseudoalteromonas luteoviolacea]AOT15623.1 hypothetical protein S40542_22860 [Pseudoalteromonas luteoviolacea]AOT21034.1 hypothetical protein S4054_25570 [Pseudoalteromonas luteoviolacea]KKE84568.1 hypothetical protein N479_08365 [Pseudoalteromonas luteoviolacea S4054]KZN71287.1 hypothetical protein N481_19055 [Pseudoalteromonas luteoviolacea S4047-1]